MNKRIERIRRRLIGIVLRSGIKAQVVVVPVPAERPKASWDYRIRRIKVSVGHEPQISPICMLLHELGHAAHEHSPFTWETYYRCPDEVLNRESDAWKWAFRFNAQHKVVPEILLIDATVWGYSTYLERIERIRESEAKIKAKSFAVAQTELYRAV